MTDPAKLTPHKKKTPADATPFEREQLRFFLSISDLAAILNELNPSLAWLPLLSEMKLIQNETQLTAWIERNFGDPDAVREVVANIQFFGPETATLLEYRLHAQAADLPPPLMKSWTLIIHHMRTARQGLAGDGWFYVVPYLQRGDYSISVLKRLANVLRPQLKLRKRLSWRNEVKALERASDLMFIDYEVEDGVSSDDVLAVWPNNAAPDTDESLLLELTTALSAALAEAIHAEVESTQAYSISDNDVPSVARHNQNEYRSGFQLIVRVMAEVWTRLANKSPDRAIVIAERWRDSPFRLMWRLAMFSFADPAVPAEIGADMLIRVPAGELFLTSLSVEVYRLIRSRWNDFPAEKRCRIIQRLCGGPPRCMFREGVDIDGAIDRSRFDILSDMVRNGFDIGPKAEQLLAEIRARSPHWEPRPAEIAGFHIWSGSAGYMPDGDLGKFEGIADSELVVEARKIAEAAGFGRGDSWRRLCVADPDRALRGLDVAASNDDWSPQYWEHLLSSRTAYSESETELRIARLLLQWPLDRFEQVADAASSWLEEHARNMPDALLWHLWDRIADATLIEPTEVANA
jgi:hypothetical protein